MRILLWHVHGGWTDAFVRGQHEYLLPATPSRDGWGLGRGGRDWSSSVKEIAPADLKDAGVDVVVLQRPQEIDEAERLLGARLGRDIGAVYVEHNTPRIDVPNTVHPLADRSDIPLVHVTHFNRLMWDSGRAPTVVIEHGVRDPGALYTGELTRLAVVVNEPVRRGRVTGTDLLPMFADIAPLDVFGIATEHLPAAVGLGPSKLAIEGDISTARLHSALARRRLYLHPLRWTSLGLSLLEAMHLAMPVVALATTEAARAIPPEAGVISNDPAQLAKACRALLEDPALAQQRGAAARAHALEHYGLRAFLDNWDALLAGLRLSRIRRLMPQNEPLTI
jgi:Glycosyl transferases group 1